MKPPAPMHAARRHGGPAVNARALRKLATALVAHRYFAYRRWFGYELSKRSGVRSGLMYPLLRNLEQRGWISSGWTPEGQGPHGVRPRRRVYYVTTRGQRPLARIAAGGLPRRRGVHATSVAVGDWLDDVGKLALAVAIGAVALVVLAAVGLGVLIALAALLDLIGGWLR